MLSGSSRYNGRRTSIVDEKRSGYEVRVRSQFDFGIQTGRPGLDVKIEAQKDPGRPSFLPSVREMAEKTRPRHSTRSVRSTQ